MNATEALVVGAGPTGLTAAIELKRFGVPVRIIDKARQPAQYSQALVVQARTLEQFERYGIAEQAVARGRKLLHASMINEGKTIVNFAFDRIASRYPFLLFLPQSETEKLLTEQLRSLGGTIERGVELAEVARKGDTVIASLIHEDGRSEEVTPRWLIGCDGAHSRIRGNLHVPFSGRSVALHFYLGDLELEGPDSLGDEVRVYLHRGDIVFIGRLSDKISRVIVAAHDTGDVQEAIEQKRQATIADFQEAIDRAGIRLKVLSADWMTPFSVNDRQAENMQIGNVFLAGDASHIHSPVGGQGMNTGIQDAANLAWKIAAVREGAPAELLSSYEEERRPVGKTLLQRTSAVLAAGTASNPLIEKVRDFVLSTASKIPVVQDFILSFVSETNIGYRHSSAVLDCGGGGSLHAGDRVPNPELIGNNGSGEPLLRDSQEARQVAIALEGPAEAALRAEFPNVRKRTLRRADFRDEAQRLLTELFGEGSRIAIVRPDGYLGFRGGPDDRTALAQYAAGTGFGA